MNKTKLIVLRGPSGSGKSTIAKSVRDFHSQPIAYIEQDYLRRIILKEKDVLGGLNIEFIKNAVLFLLKNRYDVIMDGIFDARKYKKMFQELINAHPSDNYFFYFDISLNETLKRHETKVNKDEFGKKEIREWYKEKDLLEFVEEKIIPESNTVQDSLNQIKKSL